jgi:hypothetical protein
MLMSPSPSRIMLVLAVTSLTVSCGGSSSPKAGAASQPAAQAPAAATGPSAAARYNCPLDKPQQIYGHAINAKSVLEGSETWTPDSVYLIFGPFHVKGSLAILAGSVVCFDYGPPGAESNPEPPPGEINVESGGTLKVMGTPDRHVVFTQKNDKRQYWAGIYFSSGAHTDTATMRYLDVYNAGLSAAPGVLNTFPDPTQPPLDMQHVTFYSVQRVGLKNLTAGFTPESRVLLNNYAEETPKRDLFGGYAALRVHLYGASTVTDQVFRIGDGVPKSARYVQLDHAEGMNIDKSVTLHKLQEGLAWHNIQNMKVNGSADDPPIFQLDPGVVLAVSNGGSIRIGDGGSGMANIVAAGTKEEPIVFTSDSFIAGADPKAGDWPGIVFSPGNFKSTVSRFSYVTFEYGGGTGKDTIYNCNDGRSDRPAVLLFNISSNGLDYDGPLVNNSLWRNAGGAGVRARCNVGHSGGCLKTNYEDAGLGNRFEGFDAERPATTPLGCPK